MDRAGNVENPPATVTIRIDRSAPAPQIVDPTSGTAVQDGVSFATTGGRFPNPRIPAPLRSVLRVLVDHRASRLNPDLSYPAVLSRLNQPDGGADTPNMDRHPQASTWRAVNLPDLAKGLIVAVALTLLGFIALIWFLSEPPDVPCNCPQLEAQAVSIAWLPEGDPTGRSTGFEGDKSLEVFLSNPASDPQRAVSAIRDRLGAAGFPVEMLSSGKTAFVNTGVLRISALADIEGRQVQIRVILDGADSQAPGLLAPFAETLGTRATQSIWNEHGQLTH